MNRKTLVTILTISLLVGCTSSKRDTTGLTTSISSDGSKRFIYAIDLRQREIKFDDFQSGAPQRRRGLLPTSMARIEKSLKRKIKATDFCQTGYFIYNRRYSNGQFEIYGECNEANIDLIQQ